MSKRKSVVGKKSSSPRMDGWKNVLTGIGVKGRDRREASCIEWELMDEQTAEELYAASDTAGKIVDEVVNEAFREGYELGADDENQLAGLTDEGERLKVDDKFQEAWKLARLYGGSGIIPIPRDVTQLNKPFIPERIDKIESLLVLSRWELPRQQIQYDIRSPNFSYPKSYRLCPRGGASKTGDFDQMNEVIHHSWVLRFDGAFLPRVKFLANNHWHDSVLNKCRQAIRNFDGAHSAISATLDDFSIAVMKLDGLARKIAEDKDDEILKRMEIANLSRSVMKTIMLDAEHEDYQYQDRQLSGVAEIVKQIGGRLVVASNMPHTKILGESPEGSNATGNSTTKDWYDHVASQQQAYVDPKLLTLWKWIMSAKKGPTKGQVPKGLKTVYAPLWQESEGEQAKTRFFQAQTDEKYIVNAVLDPTEVAVSRFGTGKYSLNTTLADDRTKLQKRKKTEET